MKSPAARASLNPHLALICAFLSLLPGWGASALSIKNISAPSLLVYSPDSPVQTTSSIKVAHDSYVGPFTIVLTQLSLVPTQIAPAENLSYGLYKPATAPTDRLSLTGFPSNESEVLSGTFEAVNNKIKPLMNVDFAIIVSPSSLPPPGTYTVTIQAALYGSAFPASGTPSDTATFVVTVSVPSLTDLSIVPTGGGFSPSSTSASLSFGTISAGDSRSVDVMVRSNVRYSVSLVSSNGSALANALSGSLIPYTLSVNGIPVSLPKGIASFMAVNVAPSYSKVVASSVAVLIGSFGDFPDEGTYSDLVTVNVSAP